MSTTLASESDYDCRYFAVNVQGCVSAPSPVLSFTTLHRASTAVEHLMSPKHAAHVFTVECTGGPPPGLPLPTYHNHYPTPSHPLTYVLLLLRRGDVVGDICVGDTVVMTERLYYKDQRFADEQGLGHGQGQGQGLAETLTPGGFIGERTIAAYVVKVTNPVIPPI